MSCKAREVTGKQINHIVLLLLLLRVLSILLLSGHTLFVISVLVGRRLRSVVFVEVKRIWLWILRVLIYVVIKLVKVVHVLVIEEVLTLVLVKVGIRCSVLVNLQALHLLSHSLFLF